MSGTGKSAPPITDRPGGGQAAGGQAQASQGLQLLARLVNAVEVLIVPTGFYAVRDWTSGDLDIATAFPGVSTGTFVIKTGVATNVFLPATGGPWLIVDGLGDAAADNITVKPPGIKTIRGGSSFVMSTNFQSETFILDDTDFIVTP